ncbi:MAG: hypothetical protein WC742_00675 [Gallionellaceae bacterium]
MAISSISSRISPVSSPNTSANSPLAKKLNTTASQQEASVVTLSAQARKLSMVQKPTTQNIAAPQIRPSANPTSTTASFSASAPSGKSADSTLQQQALPKNKISIYA